MKVGKGVLSSWGSLYGDIKKQIEASKNKPTLKSAINEMINDMDIKKSAEGSANMDDWADSLINDLYGNREFTYDAETDPEWQTTKKEYTAEADKTMRDVLAQGAVRTGGIASTSAITAASEARDTTMAGLEQRKAQLRNEAYSRYQQEIAAKLNLLGVVRDMAADDRNFYLSLLEKQQNDARSTVNSMLAMGMLPSNDLLYAAGYGEKDIESIRQNYSDNKKTEKRDDARSTVNSMLAMGVLPSNDLLYAAGYGERDIESIRQNYFDSMDTASMQSYLNQHGANLRIDGGWGQATEDAYTKVFGKSSGRQIYFNNSGNTASKSNGNTASRNTATRNNDTTSKDTSGELVKDKDGYYNVGGVKFKDKGRAELYKMYKDGDITYNQYTYNLKEYAKH